MKPMTLAAAASKFNISQYDTNGLVEVNKNFSICGKLYTYATCEFFAKIYKVCLITPNKDDDSVILCMFASEFITLNPPVYRSDITLSISNNNDDNFNYIMSIDAVVETA